MSDVFANHTVPEIASPTYRFQWEEAQKSFVLLYPEGMIKLNDSASEILKLCDSERTVADIIQTLNEKFPGSQLDDDVRKFLGVAHENGWIRAR